MGVGIAWGMVEVWEGEVHEEVRWGAWGWPPEASC